MYELDPNFIKAWPLDSQQARLEDSLAIAIGTSWNNVAVVYGDTWHDDEFSSALIRTPTYLVRHK